MKSKVIIPLSNSGILSVHGYSDVRDKSLTRETPRSREGDPSG